ncbi:MAG: ABC transporter ATP-binding protein [Brachymonas sp.]|nr:ABC transporter ATP-binding protein [Brachymonas sp.]
MSLTPEFMAAAALADPPAVAVHNLGKRFVLYEKPVHRLYEMLPWSKRHGREYVALDDINFELPRGQVLGLIGKNGAGKSTLLQLICGTLRPSSGTVTVNGRIAALLELGAGFNPEFTGRENIYMNASILGLEQAEIDRRYDDIVAFAELQAFIDQPVKTYSSGMYVRLAFAIATSVEPDILIIDEALSVGDGSFARKSFDRIMALKDAGATIIFCSHSMYHIEAICDQALWLERGRIVKMGKPDVVARLYGESLLLATERVETTNLDFHKGEAATLQSAQSATGQENVQAQQVSKQAFLRKVSVCIDGIEGKELKAQAGISNMDITVVFEHTLDVPVPAVVVAIETQGGQLVSSFSTTFDRYQPVTDDAGHGQVKLTCPSMPLLRGQYRIGVFLACERMLHVYDHATPCAEVEVTDDGLEQGLVFMPHAWDDGEVIPTRRR